MNIGEFPSHRMQEVPLVRSMLDLIDLHLASLRREPSDHPMLADVQGRVRRTARQINCLAGMIGRSINPR